MWTETTRLQAIWLEMSQPSDSHKADQLISGIPVLRDESMTNIIRPPF